jgi:hypothetical protein
VCCERRQRKAYRHWGAARQSQELTHIISILEPLGRY